MRSVIKIEKGVTKMPEWRMDEPVNYQLDKDEHHAIVGLNGSGKSMFVDIITGSHPLFPEMAYYHFDNSKGSLLSDNIKHITFRDTYGGDNDRTYFLQQRWNQMEIDKDTPTTGHLLEEAFLIEGDDTPERRMMQKNIYQLFDIEHLLDKYIILLSSGELRKFKLLSALLAQPRVLILDNPFIGLDAQTRHQLKLLLEHVSGKHTVQLILVLSKSDDIPNFITHVIEVKDKCVGEKKTRLQYLSSCSTLPSHILTQDREQAIVDLPYSTNKHRSAEIVRMNHVTIRYGKRIILKDLDWTVQNGERWALSGQNGSGKSTLLSLVCADNPQSYACDIALFGRQRGSGESIWDIKKHIGYVSPEMHRSYKCDLPAIRIVASGLKDSIGLYVKPDKEDYKHCKWWMDIFGIAHLADRTFLKLSSGEQRLVLLARAFVKDPDLLILDEPLHGLDDMNCRMVKDIIETFCKRRNKTLIMVTHYEEELPNCITNKLNLSFHKNT